MCFEGLQDVELVLGGQWAAEQAVCTRVELDLQRQEQWCVIAQACRHQHFSRSTPLASA